MSAKNNNPDQFKLFMTGTEWKAQVTHSTDGPMPSTWDQKSREAALPLTASTKFDHGAGMKDTLMTQGYQHDRDDPPTIIIEDAPNGKSTRMVQSEGHHRVAAAADIEAETGQPVYIPTNYVDNSSAGRRAKARRQTYRPNG